MSFVQFSKLSLAFGDRDILKDASINLHKGSKAALTGANGAGKSTLINALVAVVAAPLFYHAVLPALKSSGLLKRMYAQGEA